MHLDRLTILRSKINPKEYHITNLSKLEILVTKTIDRDLIKMHYASNASQWTHQPSHKREFEINENKDTIVLVFVEVDMKLILFIY